MKNAMRTEKIGPRTKKLHKLNLIISSSLKKVKFKTPIEFFIKIQKTVLLISLRMSIYVRYTVLCTRIRSIVTTQLYSQLSSHLLNDS
jgi:hypothetical protein